ncbi:hypothetical protein JIG36_10900 [Actinoplanes sp. LDG1-06]|uniref:Uncharacterized protein n=1 Tax=Paractinoplanes ovalisporus TaxID=2810368 RepID=A0ABS2A8B5_9ACTN|nr:hypothetical protein [Actinoplanes ovalisporus]MBM2616063.1 hypothetical protein [Actinoplanes ovalisporus]
MVDLEMGEQARGHRLDTIAAAAIVLTVDAVVLLVVAVIGVPFLMFVFGDEDGTWQRLWPYAVAWLVAVVLAVVCAAAVLRLCGFGRWSIRRVGTAAAVGIAVVAAVLVVVSLRNSPSLVLISLPFLVANVAAALVLASPERAVAMAERFTVFRPAEPPVVDDEEEVEPELVYAEDESVYARPAGLGDEPDPARTRDTIDLHAFRRRPAAGPAPRRSRGPAAMRTLAGVQLPRRARRPRPSNRPAK